MDKIKFNKEWFRNNNIVINCRTKEEVNKFIEELAKVEVTEWISGKPLENNYYFSKYKEHTCYTLGEDYKISYSSIEYFVDDNSIIRFSDLEFESDIMDTYLNTMTDTKIEAYKALTHSCTIEKPEPIIETDTQNKRTILRENVKLKSGDIIKSKDDKVGIVVGDCISWRDGEWEHILDNLYSKLVWIITSDSIKIDKGYEISNLLFKNTFTCGLEDLIIYVQDKPKEIVKKTVEVFSVKFCKTESGLSHYISDSEEIFVEDIVSPIRGEYEDLYGEVINIQIKKLSEEELKSYNKIIKIK